MDNHLSSAIAADIRALGIVGALQKNLSALKNEADYEKNVASFSFLKDLPYEDMFSILLRLGSRPYDHIRQAAFHYYLVRIREENRPIEAIAKDLGNIENYLHAIELPSGEQTLTAHLVMYRHIEKMCDPARYADIGRLFPKGASQIRKYLLGKAGIKEGEDRTKQRPLLQKEKKPAQKPGAEVIKMDTSSGKTEENGSASAVQ